jgi:hypothetical protein
MGPARHQSWVVAGELVAQSMEHAVYVVAQYAVGRDVAHGIVDECAFYAAR